MPRRKLTPGQSLVGAVSARTTNDTIRVLEHADRIGLWQPPRPEIVRRQPQATVFMARNDTGANLSIGDVVSLDGLGVDPSNFNGELKREVTFAAGPVTANTGHRFGVATQPIEAGAWGPVCVSGACMCQVNVTDVAHSYASSTNGATYLTSTDAGGGAVILWHPGTTGVTECVVRIDRGTAEAPWPLVRLYSGSFKSEYSTTSYIASGYPGDVKFSYYNGDASACGITITGDAASAFGDPLLTFNETGLYLFLPKIAGEASYTGGVSFTSTVTTGAASAGTAHTHDVECPIEQFAQIVAYLYKRASGGGAWGAAQSYAYGNITTLTSNQWGFAGSGGNGASMASGPMFIRSITAGDELLLRCYIYHTADSGTPYFTHQVSELTITKVSDDDTQHTVT